MWVLVVVAATATATAAATMMTRMIGADTENNFTVSAQTILNNEIQNFTFGVLLTHLPGPMSETNVTTPLGYISHF